MIRWARDEARACASVLATTKSTPDRPERIMLLIALPPAPPMPHTIIRGFSSFSWGGFRSIGIPSLSRVGRAPTPPHPFLLGRKAGPSGIAFPPAPTCDACTPLSGLSLRQAGDFTSMVNAPLIRPHMPVGPAAAECLWSRNDRFPRATADNRRTARSPPNRDVHRRDPECALDVVSGSSASMPAAAVTP